jgi:hypothetical protein
MSHFRYEHPPFGPGKRRKEIPRLPGLKPVGEVGSLDAEIAAERRNQEDEGRLMRVRRVSPDEAERQRNEWLGAGDARLIETPQGVHAWERRRPDASVPGGFRLLRLAVAMATPESTLVYWSVPEPVSPVENDRWHTMVSRLAGESGPTGWLA